MQQRHSIRRSVTPEDLWKKYCYQAWQHLQRFLCCRCCQKEDEPVEIIDGITI